jgi:hypothetical protein
MQKIFQLTACLVVMSSSSLMGMGSETSQEKDMRIISQLRLVSPQAKSEFDRVCQWNKVGEGQQASLYWPGIRKDLNDVRRDAIERQTCKDNRLLRYNFYHLLLCSSFTMTGVINYEMLSLGQTAAMGLTLLSAINNLVNLNASCCTYNAFQKLHRQSKFHDMIIDYSHRSPNIKTDTLFNIIHGAMKLSYQEYADVSNVLSESKNQDGYFNRKKYLEQAKGEIGQFFPDPRDQTKYRMANLLNNVSIIAIALLFIDKSVILFVSLMTNFFGDLELTTDISSYGKDRELKEGLDEIIHVIDTHMVPED